jgi:ketosteroid isomerase-like protein
MGNHENVGLLRRGYEAFAAGDMATIDTLFADDIVWHTTGAGPLSGDYKGKEAVFGFFGKLLESTGGQLEQDIHDVLANDEHGVVILTTRAKREGRSLDERGVHVFHLSAGKVTEFWGLAENPAAGDAFFS